MPIKTALPGKRSTGARKNARLFSFSVPVRKYSPGILCRSVRKHYVFWRGLRACRHYRRTYTWVTAPTSLPSWRMGLPLTIVSIEGQKLFQLFYIAFSSGVSLLSKTKGIGSFISSQKFHSMRMEPSGRIIILFTSSFISWGVSSVIS